MVYTGKVLARKRLKRAVGLESCWAALACSQWEFSRSGTEGGSQAQRGEDSDCWLSLAFWSDIFWGASHVYSQISVGVWTDYSMGSRESFRLLLFYQLNSQWPTSQNFLPCCYVAERIKSSRTTCQVTSGRIKTASWLLMREVLWHPSQKSHSSLQEPRHVKIKSIKGSWQIYNPLVWTAGLWHSLELDLQLVKPQWNLSDDKLKTLDS